MKNLITIYQQAYLQSLFSQSSSTTDYTPNQFVQKIYEDIKKQDLHKDFIIEYNLDNFKKYVNKNNFKYYNQFIKKFKDNNFSIVILNYSIFDNNKINTYITEHIQNWNDIKTKVRNFNINANTDKTEIQTALIKYKKLSKKYYKDMYLIASNKKKGLELINKAVSNRSKLMLKTVILNFYNGKPAQIENKEITSNQIFKQVLNKYLADFRKEKGIETHNITNGFCQMFNNGSGFVFFINKNLINFNENYLSEIYYLINHEIDHYFEITINETNETSQQNNKSREQLTKPEDVQKINKTKQKLLNNISWIKYVFQRSEFNSRTTDLCNILLNEVVPVSEENSVNDLINAIKLFAQTENYTTLFKFKWLNKQDNKIKDTLIFAALTYKIFPDKYWPKIEERLNIELQNYLKMSSTEQNNYKTNLQKKFNRSYPKTDSFLEKCGKSKNLFKTIVFKAKRFLAKFN